MNKKQKMTSRFISKPSLLCLIFGTYAVLCQITLILLHVLAAPESYATDVLRQTFLPWLEYPLMSLTLIFGGALLMDYAQK